MISKILLDTFKDALPLACADVVIVHFDKVLLLRRTIPPAGIWALPGGIIQKGQYPQETAMARLYAETGIRPDGTDTLLGPIVVTYMHENGRQDVTITYKLLTTTVYPVTLNNEHDMYQWVRWGKLPEPILGPTITQIAWAFGRHEYEYLKEGTAQHG